MLKRTLPIGTTLQILQNKSIWLVLKFIPKKTKFPEKIKTRRMLSMSERSISDGVVHNFEHKSGQWWMKMTDYYNKSGRYNIRSKKISKFRKFPKISESSLSRANMLRIRKWPLFFITNNGWISTPVKDLLRNAIFSVNKFQTNNINLTGSISIDHWNFTSGKAS